MKTYKRTFPDKMPMFHRRQYVRNLREIRRNEAAGYNLDWNENLRNANHLLVCLYVAPGPSARTPRA